MIMKLIIQQAINLMRQNPLHTAINVVGTAVTVAFVMVVVMIYDFRTAEIAPETDRDRMMYTDRGSTSLRNGTNINSGMGRIPFEALFTDLPAVEMVTYHAGLNNVFCSLPASADREQFFMRSVAANWFSFFDYTFIAGRAFTQEEYDASRAIFVKADDEWRDLKEADDARRLVILSENVARRFFGSAEKAVGKELIVDFSHCWVVGVVRNVSSIFQAAYADVFQPFSCIDEEAKHPHTAGLSGVRLGVLKLQDAATSPEVVRAEVARREKILNEQGHEYLFRMQHLYTHTEQTFFKGSAIDARLVYALLIAILLIVPAISISGMTHAQMQGRLSEIAIRKAYGASNHSILIRLFGESFVHTLIGGVVGYLLACLFLLLGKTWMFGTGDTALSGIAIGDELLIRPTLFVAVLSVCLVFNLLSTLLPAWLAVHRNISATLKGGE